jgi:single-stranded-DNA-specific exonuclease
MLKGDAKDRPKLVYFDPDVDGLFAGKLACNYFDTLGYSYETYVNSDRAHGFKHDLESLRGYFIFAVDFAMTTEEVKRLVEHDISIIVIDHHDTEDELIYVESSTTGARGIVINNQYPFEPEEDRYLSGAGVVYETLCQIDETYQSEERRSLVGITLLSDARQIENPKAKSYLQSTYNANPSRGYMRYLLDNTVTTDYGFGVPRMDRNFVDYTFSPRINAMLRFNYHNEALRFIMGYGLTLEDLRGKQRQVLAELKNNMVSLDLDSIQVLVIKEADFNYLDELVGEDVNLSNFIGLLCSDVKGLGKSTLGFILTQDGTVRRASFRGEFDDVHYRTAFHSLGIDAQGHQVAFGIRDFTFTNDTWINLDAKLTFINQGHKPTVKLITASSLSYVLNAKGKIINASAPDSLAQGVATRGYDIAYENCFVRDMYRTYIRYTGNLFTKMNSHKGYTEYLINGLTVKCFDDDIDPKTGLILPLLEKGYVQLYLKKIN